MSEPIALKECPHGVYPYAMCEYCDQMYMWCLAHLVELGVVLWPQYYDISDDKQRHEAAKWLAETIHSVLPGWYLAQLAPEPTHATTMGGATTEDSNDSRSSQDTN